MCQHTDTAARPWSSLAGLRGTAKACTCSDMQLAHVGCECDAEQNLPVSCEDCGAFLRTEKEILTLTCNGCRKHAAQQEVFEGSSHCECGARCITETERTFGLCTRCGDDLYDQAH